MESFAIGGTYDGGILEFFDRVPEDSDQPLQAYCVRVTCGNLAAAASILTYDFPIWPTPFFDEMAERWKGWPGELTWGSFEGEVGLRCEQDRSGHITIRVDLHSSPLESEWTAVATVRTVASQLERIARNAEAFFGKPPRDT